MVELKVRGGGSDLAFTLTNRKHKKSDTVKVVPYMPKSKLTEKKVTVRIPVRDFIGDKEGFAESKVMVSVLTQGEENVNVTVSSLPCQGRSGIDGSELNEITRSRDDSSLAPKHAPKMVFLFLARPPMNRSLCSSPLPAAKTLVMQGRPG